MSNRKAITKRTITVLTALGNPESTYKNTRHNAGHVVLDSLLQNHLIPRICRNTNNYHWKPWKNGKLHYISALTNNLVFIRSDGLFMNTCGPDIIKFWKELKNALKDRNTGNNDLQINHIVLHDELAKGVGKIQYRDFKTSTRGHNGLKSLLSSCGGNGNPIRFDKIGIGIDRPVERDPRIVADYVLSKFFVDELDILSDKSTLKVLEELEKKGLIPKTKVDFT
ncbi:aminoacyl-tRNA hydrolase SCDLUD_001250 [Saccharomycodes ludwigii]|uniref:aminoacyl-tRNA hydrolase n=1 Tax=Saccharomycodes ludwigii TaxID=36035 RepID=UPI001E88B8DC|nr:hypothetical protein SCDLUD_001250 [Saccharomycodes ludwigii]KAH3903606.1 hypothetical protein SCDLUD_001250 [Saccharomycodes ludwigii]